MAQRCNEQNVRDLLKYVPSGQSLKPFIRTAVAMTDWLVSQDADSLITDALAEEIESFLAAHYFSLKYPVNILSSQSASKASESYLDHPTYEETAARLDPTGLLQARLAGKTAPTAFWGGLSREDWPNR